MKLSKEDALKKIKELEDYINEIDNPKLVRVYVKESCRTIIGKTSATGYIFNKDMEGYIGKTFDVKLRKYTAGDRVLIEGWYFDPEWLIFVEGKYADLEQQ